MARVDADKPINPTQLGIELGRVPLRVVEGSHVESDAVEQATLEDAVEAHMADEDYVDPEYVPPPDPQDEFRQAVTDAVANEPAGSPLKKLADALLGTTGPGAEPRRPTR